MTGSRDRVAPSPPDKTPAVLPEDELRFTYARSGGPGGQNVNKVSSKATLRWNVAVSAALPEDVRQRLFTAYRKRITRDGILVIVSQRYRERSRNVADCLERLHDMLQAVARPPKRRRPTKPTRGSRERRLRDKRARSVNKAGRRRGSGRDEPDR